MIVFVGGATLYYRHSNNRNRRPPSRSAAVESSRNVVSHRKEGRGKENPTTQLNRDGSSLEDPSIASSKNSKKKRPRAEQASNHTDQPAPVENNDSLSADMPDQDSADQEWARQLQAAKKGVDFSAATARGTQQKSKGRKGQSHDVRPLTDPKRDIKAHDKSLAPGNGPASEDVSDMLEAPAPGASVLRLIGEEKPQKSKPQQPSVETETKKQRQNRRKVEEKKALLQEQEKERQQLLEKQRRTAREARGEPAKNGLSGSVAPSMNAWSKPVQHSDLAEPLNDLTKQPLLDTFEHETTSTGSGKGQTNESPTPVSSVDDYGLPSEETQMEMIQEMNGWNEVPKTRRNKKKTPTPVSPPTKPGVKETKQKSYEAVSTSDLIGGPQGTTATSGAHKPRFNGFAALEAATNIDLGTQSHPDDSEWPVE